MSGSDVSSTVIAPPHPAPSTTDSNPDRGSIAHFVTFGNGNQVDSDSGIPSVRAIVANWESGEFIEPVTIPWNVSVRRQDIIRLVMGVVPYCMEDKWFIYSEDINFPVSVEGKSGEEAVNVMRGLKVHFIRSWTGSKILELEVLLSRELDENGMARSARVGNLVYENDEDVMGGAEEGWAKELAREICAWVVGVELGQEGAAEVGE